MPFTKGDTNINRNGAPKREWTWSGVLAQAMEEVMIKNENGQAKEAKVKELVAKALISEAMKGNVVATKEIMNRMDGMPQQDVTSGGEAIKGPTVFIPKEIDG